MEGRLRGVVRALASVTTLVILAGGCMASPQPSLPSGVPAAKPGTAGPSGVPTETAFVLVGGSDPGFELRVPERWVEADVLFSDAQRWEGDDGAVMVSYGASIFDGGGITQCGPPTPELPACTKEAYPNSIPYDPSVDGVGPLPIDGYLRDRCVRRCHVELAATTLGGERAQRASTTIGRLRVTYVATYHDRRPVIVYWSEPESAVDDARIDAMLASFRFVDPATPTQTPFVDPTELVPYQDTELGYEILSPRFWGTGTERGGVQGVREFGSGRGFGTRSFPALSISVGSTEGAVTVCQGVSHRCDVIVASELADLEAHWREEEALAEIIDGELTPLPLLESLRRRVIGQS